MLCRLMTVRRIRRALAHSFCSLCLANAAMAATALAPLPLKAESFEEKSAGARQHQQECGACHLAFPAQALPAASWQRLMGGLRHHFGVDASLDPATTRELSTWLQAHTATGPWVGGMPREDRITTSAWFLREHDEVPAATWKRPVVGKPSNCAACHKRAIDGRFGEAERGRPR
jgi:hypothetical protein